VTGSSAKPSSGCDRLTLPDSGTLHLWLCRRANIDDSNEFLRCIVAGYAGHRRLQISRGEHGKPALRSPRLPLDFNLSDSAEWLALLVSGGAAVGVDIERCDPRRDVMRLARRWFSAAECAALDACSGAATIDLFYELWTLKEAHIKAAGGSLWRDLPHASFAVYRGAGLGTIDTRAAPAGARYALLKNLPGYRIALCCLGAGSFTDRLEVFEWAAGVALPQPAALLAVSREASATPQVTTR
jgi:phosphopantetheinyl transferase